MTKFRAHYAVAAISAAVALTLDAMPAAAYQQLSREVLVYRSPGAADDLPRFADDLPPPPRHRGGGYNELSLDDTSGKEKAPPGSAPKALRGPHAGPPKIEHFDYPGSYAQRFDGVDPGGPKRGARHSATGERRAK